MTQIKIFSEKTYGDGSPNGLTIDGFSKIINDYLAEQDGKITIKDIKYSIQRPNPNNSIKEWVVMLIYETK